MEKFLDIDLFINPEKQSWQAKFRDITQPDPIGDIDGTVQGKIRRRGEKRIFTISNSELSDFLRGKGYGVLMYKYVIKKILSVWPDAEIHSSSSLNKYSKGVWESLTREYDNVTKVGRHYEVIPLKTLQ